MPLDLLVPDLLAPRDAPAAMRELRLPALERWLARADLESVAADGARAWLAAAYALPAPVPEAAIALAGERSPAPGAWVRADPVHLRIDGDGLVLHDASILDVRREEADALLAALQAHFAPDGLVLQAPAPERWYARVPEGELPRTVALDAALGRNAFGLLPTGSGRINWRAAITEAQMVLSQHPVNVEREAAQRPVINSVWFWGEGTTPAGIARAYASVHARDPFGRGLGALSGAAVQGVPGKLDDVDLLSAGESALVLLDALVAPLRRVAMDEWRTLAQALDERWFAALPRAIERFGAVRLVLPRSGGTLVARLDRRAARRWFRRPRPLASHA